MNRGLRSMRRGIARCSVALACLLGTVSVAPPAYGQATAEDIERARRLFQRAIEYKQAENWGKAVELFREVAQVKLSPQVRFHIAHCEENLGKLMAAMGGYKLALKQADKVGPAFKQDLEERIQNLLAHIPKLIIKRGKGAEAATISLDGTELGPKSLGIPMPVNPGPHTVTAKAPDRENFMETVTVKEKRKQTLTVKMKKRTSEAAAGGDNPGLADKGVAPKPPDRTVPYIVGGAGGVFLLGAGACLFLRQRAYNDLEEACKPGNFERCEASDQKQAEGYKDNIALYGTLAGVTAAVGFGALVVAGTMILTETSSAPTQAGLHLAPAAPGAQAGLSVFGRF